MEWLLVIVGILLLGAGLNVIEVMLIIWLVNGLFDWLGDVLLAALGDFGITVVANLLAILGFIGANIFLVRLMIGGFKKVIRVENLRAAGLPAEDLTDDEEVDYGCFAFVLLLLEGFGIIVIIGWRLGFISL